MPWSRKAASPKATGRTPSPCARPAPDAPRARRADAPMQARRMPDGLCDRIAGEPEARRPPTRPAQTKAPEEPVKIRSLSLRALGAFGVALLAGTAYADINIGVTLSATGPAASLGIPEKNTIELLPTSISGEKINWIVLDDGSDT